MQFRYGILNLLRSWKKTLAFFLLLTMLTAALSLTAGVCQTATDFLDRCEDNFLTIAQMEYAADETETFAFTPAAAEAAEALTLPEYVRWEPAAAALGHIPGVRRDGMGTPGENAAVLEIRVSTHDERLGLYTAYVTNSLYARKDRTDQIVYLRDREVSLQPNHRYLIHGEYYISKGTVIHLRVTECINPLALESGFDGSLGAMLVDVTDEEKPLEAHPEFLMLADYYTAVANGIIVTATEHLEALYPFHQDQLTLSEGQGVSAGDGKKIVLSEVLAQRLGLQVGDQVELSMAARAGCGLYEGYWPGNGYDETDFYTIAGLFEGPEADSFRAFIPRDASVVPARAQWGSLLGQALVPNARAGEFYETVSSALPNGVQMTVLDQGYAAAAAPFADILQAARLILLACAAVGLAILALFGYLFLYRQRDVMTNMHRLGVPGREARVYFLSGAGLLALVSALTGMGLSQLLSGRVTRLVRTLLRAYHVADTRYSISNMGVIKTVAFTPQMALWVFGLTALLVWLSAMAVCLLFAGRMMNGSGGRRKAARRHRGLSRSLSGGPWKFAWLSVLRGGGKSLTPLCVLLCAVILLGLLPFTAQDYRRQQWEIESNTTILGYYTNSTGRLSDGMTIPADQLQRLEEAGARKMTVTHRNRYGYEGYFDESGTYHGNDIKELKKTPYVEETKALHLSQGPSLVAANRLDLTPEFRYATDLSVRWMEGCDESSLGYHPAGEPYGCVVPEGFLKEHGLDLGQRILLTYLVPVYKGWSFEADTYRIIGAYSVENSRDSIYTEVSDYLNKNCYSYTTNIPAWRVTYNSAAFTLSAGSLPTMRDALEDLGYSRVGEMGENRRWVVLDDRTYLDTQQAMAQRLRYMDILFPVVYAMTELLALAASYLLTMNHKKDLAVMRSQGASRGTGFWSLFLNQLLLCLAGMGIGCALLAVTRTWTPLGVGLVVGFLALWLLGSSISILRMNQREIVRMMRSAE